MRTFSLALILAAVTVFSLNSCRKIVGRGPVISETRVTGNFNGIRLEVPGELRYTTGPEISITIQAQRNIIDYIETYVSGGDLRIRLRDNVVLRTSEDILITVTGPTVRRLILNGSGLVRAMSDLETDAFKLVVNGSGDISVQKVVTPRLEAEIKGSGMIEVSEGTADETEARVEGSGEIDLREVQAGSADARISGSGEIRLRVDDHLNAEISGSGTIYYYGQPTVQTKISGSGRIIKM